MQRTRLQRQSGQAIVIVAFMFIVLYAGVGLAIDSAFGYFASEGTERAAAAGALSGVIFMPYEFGPADAQPPGSRNDATDRAKDESARNGFADGVTNTTVTVTGVPGFSNRLSVRVQRTVPTFFMGIFGITNYPVAHTAISTYLPPISLGQPGGQIGSRVSDLGSSGFFFLRTEGWVSDRGQGDAYTPSPTIVEACGPACPSTDVHQISGAVDSVDSCCLTSRGGYNFRVIVPPSVPGGVRIQVYNAAFSPDNGYQCELHNPSQPPVMCINSPPIPANYNYHEDDGGPFSSTDQTRYSAMEYTVYRMANHFNRNQDTRLSMVKVMPLNAHPFGVPATYGTWTDPNNGFSVVNGCWDASGNPLCMHIYHDWIDVMNYEEPAPNQNFVQYQPGPNCHPGCAALGPGLYRLRVDTLEYNGTPSPPLGPGPGRSGAHKGYAVRVTLADGVTPCSACSLGGMSDMALFTPFTNSANSRFDLPLFQLPPDYAGRTIQVDIFDPGDINPGAGGSLYLGILSPVTTCGSIPCGVNVAPQQVNLYNLGNSRCTVPCGTGWGTPSTAYVLAASGAGYPFDNFWLHYDLPIPGTWATDATSDPNNWWWKLSYQTTNSVEAHDTITIAISLKGSPAHLISS
jgi:hypothetical protein